MRLPQGLVWLENPLFGMKIDVAPQSLAEVIDRDGYVVYVLIEPGEGGKCKHPSGTTAGKDDIALNGVHSLLFVPTIKG